MNNDRFKFRVWNEEKRKYHSGAFGLSPSGELLVEWVMGFIHYPDAYSIEQCTGLKDKNGRLIYEGDILKDSAGNDTLTIVYQNGALGYVWSKQFHPMPPWIKDFVVIGNIHEANGAHGVNGESEVKE